MYTQQIGKNLFIVELNTGGIKNLICSYVIKGNNPFLVEAGPTNSVPDLLAGLEQLGVKLGDVEYVAITHVHLDHGGGTGTLLKHLPNAKVIVHPRGMLHLVDPERLWPSSQAVLGFVSDIFGKPEPVPKERIIPLTQGAFDLGFGAKLTVTETLGHASHNLSFQETMNNGVFPGDAAGTYFPEFDLVVPTTPPPFHLGAALASIDRLISLNPTALYYSHFGKALDAVRRLKEYKVQLQLWARITEEGVKKNQSLKQVRNRILAEDPVMRKVADFVMHHKIYSKTVMASCIAGFMDNAKQKALSRQS